MMRIDEELKCIESMHASALRLSKSEDPLLRGQIAQILGAIEGLMTIVGAPPAQRATNATVTTDVVVGRKT